MRFLKTMGLLAFAALVPALFATAALPEGLYAEFTSAHGVVTVELLPEKAPLAVTNFVGLTEGTLGPKQPAPYYTGLKWYRVVPGFVIQSGNPQAPVESDAGYTFADEFSPGLNHGVAGILSMANGGPDTNSGEFFFTLADDTRLNYLHSVFGRTVRGVEILPQIKKDDPFTIKIRRVGAAATAFKADASTFKVLRDQSLAYRGEKEPGPTAHFDDPDKLLPTEAPRANNFNYKLANFERTMGVRIVARIFARAPTAEEDTVAGDYMRALARKLGVAERGALAVYFAADDDWRVWIGNASTSAFFGQPPTASDLGEGAAFHDVKESFLAAIRARGDAAYVAQKKAASPDTPPPASQQLKLQTDAMLDGLISTLTPR